MGVRDDLARVGGAGRGRPAGFNWSASLPPDSRRNNSKMRGFRLSGLAKISGGWVWPSPPTPLPRTFSASRELGRGEPDTGPRAASVTGSPLSPAREGRESGRGWLRSNRVRAQHFRPPERFARPGSPGTTGFIGGTRIITPSGSFSRRVPTRFRTLLPRIGNWLYCCWIQPPADLPDFTPAFSTPR